MNSHDLLLKRFLPARLLFRALKWLIVRSPFAKPGTISPFNLVVFPPLSDKFELLDIYYKFQYFLPPQFIHKISLSVSEISLIDSVNISWPDYIARFPTPIASFEWLLPHQGFRYWQRLLQADYILVWDKKKLNDDPFTRILEAKIKHVDRHESIWDGWSWAQLGNEIVLANDPQISEQAQEKFSQYIESLPKFTKAYVFGTGPSLDQAYQFDFSDGYRIVCNTIVKNRHLLEHIYPHFIVAADAIYHFGNNKHAYQFRCDLEDALEMTQAMFLTADFFTYLIKYHHPRIFQRTIPVRTDLGGIFLDMKNTLAYTGLPNILNGLLLPLGSSLANRIYLLGFDGRAPNDTLFWQNSGANSYEELKPTIMAAHPGFFNGINYEEYAHSQSDSAEQVMILGEQMGKKYYCLNQTFIPAFQKRLHPHAIRMS